MKVPPVSNVIPMNNKKKRKQSKDDFKRLFPKPPDDIA